MFRLGYKVGSDASRVAVCADDHGFGRTRQEFNGAIESYELLGCGHVPVAWTDDLVHAGDFCSPVGKGSDGLSPADSVELTHAEVCSCRQGCSGRARRRDANLFDTGHLRWNYRHEQCRWQRIAAARDIASHRFQGAHQLAHEDAWLNFPPPLFLAVLRRLPLRIAADIARSLLDRLLQLWIRSLPSRLEIGLGNTERLTLAQSVPTCGVAAYRQITVPPHVIHNATHRRLNLCEIRRTALRQGSHKTSLRAAFENPHYVLPHHITTLFSGYSTMP